MFEVVGLLVLRALGYGWLWGRHKLPSVDEAFGNGGNLFVVGVLACAFLIIVMMAIGNVHWRAE